MVEDIGTSEQSGSGSTSPRHHGCLCGRRETLLTVANLVTLIRTVAAVGIGLVGAYEGMLWLLLVSLAVYWIGDIADGAIARLTDTETRTGAVLDILCDRLCAATFYIGFVWLDPTMALPVGVFLVSFVVVDAYLSFGFLAWPLLGPNYFHLVDRTIWLLNWSKLGKAVNSSAVAVLMVTTRSVWLCTAIAVVLLGLKVWSTIRLARIGLPVPAGCAWSEASGQTYGRMPDRWS